MLPVRLVAIGDETNRSNTKRHDEPNGIHDVFSLRSSFGFSAFEVFGKVISVSRLIELRNNLFPFHRRRRLRRDVTITIVSVYGTDVR